MPINIFGSLNIDSTLRSGSTTQNGSLTVDIDSFYYQGHSIGYFSGALNQAVNDNTTNYIFINSSGSLLISSSYPSDQHIRLSRVITVSGSIIAINDERGFLKSFISGTSEHVHSNKAQLDLVTDGDHDARTDNPHTVTKTQVGLGNVDNVEQIPLSQKGVASGVATLDSTAHLPVTQLPTASITPSQITSDQTDYAPSNFTGSYTVSLNTDAPRTINSFASGSDGRLFIIQNYGSQPISFSHEGAGTAVNRFTNIGSGSALIPTSGSMFFHYDSTAQRWRPVTALSGSVSGTIVAQSVSIAAQTTQVAAISSSNAIFEARSWKNSVDAATTTDLPSYTRSGTPTGTTITGNASSVLTIDGKIMNISQSFFFGAHSGSTDSAGHPDFGIYVITATGSVSSPWSARRRSDFDSSSDIANGAIFRVNSTNTGSRFGNTGWKLVTTGSVLLNTTPLLFQQESSKFAYQVFTASATWTRPEGVNFLMYALLRPGAGGGAGGSGGGAGYGAASAGGGGGGRGGPGGGGACFERFDFIYLSSSSYIINVGAGGAGGAGGSGGTGSVGNGTAGGSGGTGTDGGYTEILDNAGNIIIRVGQFTTALIGGGGSIGPSGGSGGTSTSGAAAGAAGSATLGLAYGRTSSAGTLGAAGSNGAAAGANSSQASSTIILGARFITTEATKTGVILPALTGVLGATGSGGTHGAGGVGGPGGSGGIGDEYSIFGLLVSSGAVGGNGLGNGGNGNSAGVGVAGANGVTGSAGFGGRGGGGGQGGGGGGAGTTGGAGGAGGKGGAGSDGAAIFVWKVGV